MSKKRMTKRKLGMLWGLVLMLFLHGCGGGSSTSTAYDSEIAYMETTAAYPQDSNSYRAGLGMPSVNSGEEIGVMEDAGEDAIQADTLENPDGVDNRKLIKTVDLSVETKQFDVFLQSIEEQVQTFGGYIEQSDVRGLSYQESSSRRYANLTIRVPISKVDSFVGSVSEECNVLHKSEYVEDITLRYTDLESRKKALAVEQERLMELLSKAESMDAIISIEERLSDIRYELENYESQLRLMDNQVAYSTVSIRVEEAEVFTPVVEDSFWTQVQKGFQTNLRGVGLVLRNFAIWLLSSIPLLVFWGVVIAILVLLCILIIRKSEAHRKKRQTLQIEESAKQTERKAQIRTRMEANKKEQGIKNMEDITEKQKETKLESKANVDIEEKAQTEESK